MNKNPQLYIDYTENDSHEDLKIIYGNRETLEILKNKIGELLSTNAEMINIEIPDAIDAVAIAPTLPIQEKELQSSSKITAFIVISICVTCLLSIPIGFIQIAIYIVKLINFILK